MVKHHVCCNRCGKDIPSSAAYITRDFSARIQWYGVGATRSNPGERIDLCVECAESFIKWLESEVQVDG